MGTNCATLVADLFLFAINTLSNDKILLQIVSRYLLKSILCQTTRLYYR